MYVFFQELYRKPTIMKTLLSAILLFTFSITKGQFTEPKFGKIEMSDMTMTSYEKDTTAGALILFNSGKSGFILNSSNNFQYVFEKHMQVKILKKSAVSLADISIRLYKKNQKKEDLRELKAVTYNLVDGKIVKTKLDNDNIYRSEADNYITVSFAFPEVKEGSVIELSYSIISDFLYNFRGWNFQNNYPQRWSQYYYEIPEYFQYRESTKGYLMLDVNKRSEGKGRFSITQEQIAREDEFGNRKPQSAQYLEPMLAKSTLAIKDVPAFISEPNIDCEDNYLQCIEFELSSVQFPNQAKQQFTETWETVNNQMNNDEDFGKLLNQTGFVKDTISVICNSKATEIEKAVTIYNYVQKRMKWNGTHSIWAMKGLKKPFNEQVGSSSEINLLLTMMLRAAGLNADPVMFSTRENGIAITFYPTISKFNSILSVVDINGKVYLLDATSKYCPFGVLPPADINGRGRSVNKMNGTWVSLEANETYKEEKNYDLQLNKDGVLTGSISGNYYGYAGVVYRNSLNLEKSSDDYIRKMQENLKGLTVNKYSIAEVNNIYRPVKDTIHVEITDQVELIGDKLVLKPLLFEAIEKNRYTLEERKYPVDYNYPISELYNFSYTIPEGYIVESMPESGTVSLPDNSISFSYKTSKTDKKIFIEYTRNIKKILFLPNEYNDLKNLYDQMVKKHSEMIILKKSV
jgi:hypothetical protein